MSKTLTLWTLDVKILTGYDNEPKKEWSEIDETVTVSAKTIEEAIEKTKKHTFTENSGSYWEDGKRIKYWVAGVRVISAKSDGTVDIL